MIDISIQGTKSWIDVLGSIKRIYDQHGQLTNATLDMVYRLAGKEDREYLYSVPELFAMCEKRIVAARVAERLKVK